MRWQGRNQSSNIEDRRRTPGPGVARVGGLGAAGVVIVLLLGAFFGVDVTPLLQEGGSIAPAGSEEGGPLSPQEEQAGQFAAVVLADTETIWQEIFRTQLGEDYPEPTLVLFSGATASPCGDASGATGPFYCPPDRKAYLDTQFFAVLDQQLGAGGDFAAAYVIAHEVGHHIQNVLGILGEANDRRQRLPEAEANRISVMIELQADCFAGVWAHHAKARLGSIEAGDFDEALNAARRIGDDTLQRAAGRRPMPHTFTHGTSEQRRRWFERGLQTGRIDQCDTFAAREL
jgi:hypothetical protein